MWRAQLSKDWENLFTNALQFFNCNMLSNLCYSELREYLLVLPEEYQIQFRLHAAKLAKEASFKITDFARGEVSRLAGDFAAMTEMPQIREWLGAEATSLRIEYLLTIGQATKPQVDYIYAFLHNLVRLQNFACSIDSAATVGFEDLLVSALMRAYSMDPSEEHLILAISLLQQFESDTYPPTIFRMYLSARLGTYLEALIQFKELSLKEIQMETCSHLGLTRVSICIPAGVLTTDDGSAGRTARDLLISALGMFQPTIEKIADQQSSLVDCSRFDLLLELEEVRKSLEHSLNRRLLILELRRLDRLTGRGSNTKYVLHPAVIDMWTEDLHDNRDFTICSYYDAGTDQTPLDRRLQDEGAVPDADWIRYHVWVDEICSLTLGGSLLTQPYLDAEMATRTVEQSVAFTKEEKAMVPFWKALGTASVLVFAPEQAEAPCGSTQDLASVLEQLYTVVTDLEIDRMIPSTKPSQQLPSASVIQAILLQMDFVIAVGRFVDASGSRAKATGIKLSKQIQERIKDAARAYFDRLRKYALDRRGRLDSNKIANTIEKSWQRMMQTTDFEREARPIEGDKPADHSPLSNWKSPESHYKAIEVLQHAESLAWGARVSWDSILQIKFAS